MYSIFEGVNLSIIFEKNNYLYLKIFNFCSKIRINIIFQNEINNMKHFLAINKG